MTQSTKPMFAQDLQGKITGRDLSLLFMGITTGIILGLYWAWVLLKM